MYILDLGSKSWTLRYQFSENNTSKPLVRIIFLGEDEDWTPGKPLEGHEDDQQIIGSPKKTKRSSVRSKVESDKFRVEGGWVCK